MVSNLVVAYPSAMGVMETVLQLKDEIHTSVNRAGELERPLNNIVEPAKD